MELFYASLAEYRRLRAANIEPQLKARAFAALCRVNVLYMVKRAGSGHLGTSFSSQDLISWVLLNELEPGGEGFFSSKGHDAPAIYAALIGLERLPFEGLHALRRMGGLPGHPDVGTPAIETNTGSLGMGISKAKGMILARRAAGRSCPTFVLLGDGELEEGQIWESLPSAVRQRMGELTVIVDQNKIQSDTWVKHVSEQGDLDARFAGCGWHVSRVNGHDMRSIAATLGMLRRIEERPKVVIADTVKGKGVSFMEQFEADGRFYGFHSGAPSDAHYVAALGELTDELGRAFDEARLRRPSLESIEHMVAPKKAFAKQPERLLDAYGRALVEAAEKEPRLVVLDADLIKDCALPEFADRFPERLVECGIAEQDMVSQAGGLALKGSLPIVHSFSAFLSARPNEQIYNNSSERTQVIYVGTLAGLLPATPGHSHQSVRDIGALGSIPNLVMIAPSSEHEVRAALMWALANRQKSSYLRICFVQK